MQETFAVYYSYTMFLFLFFTEVWLVCLKYHLLHFGGLYYYNAVCPDRKDVRQNMLTYKMYGHNLELGRAKQIKYQQSRMLWPMQNGKT